MFWSISGLQLLLLMKSLPLDQDAMEAELATYAKSAINGCNYVDIAKVYDENDPTAVCYGTVAFQNERSDCDHLDFRTPPPVMGIPLTVSSLSDDFTTPIVSIEDRRTSFDGTAVQQSLLFMRLGILEIREELQGALLCGTTNEERIRTSSRSNSMMSSDDESDAAVVVRPSPIRPIAQGQWTSPSLVVEKPTESTRLIL
jgi:hypothetical protein